MSRFESGCRRFTEMYPNWRRDLPRKQGGRETDVGVQIPPSPLCSRSPSGRGNRFKPGQGRVQIPPGVHTLVPERNMDPAKDRRFAGSNPPQGYFSVCGAMEDALCSGHSPRGCGFDSRHTDFKEDCRNGRRGRFKPGFLRVRIPCPSFTTSRKGGISHAMH